MNDNTISNYMEKLLMKEYEKDNFEEYIDVFSKFLGYTKESYKYNSTYLSQYTSDFLRVHNMLKLKDKKYNEIFIALAGIELVSELLIDNVFWVNYKSSVSVIKGVYVAVDEDKIVSQKIEIRIKIVSKGNEYVFCKEYVDFQVDGLVEMICDDVDEYIEIKIKQEEKNETSRLHIE